MSPRWKRTADAPAPHGAGLFMDAVLTPHRSFSRAAFRFMLIGVIAVNVLAGAYFVSKGAFPVAGFLGLDVLAVWLAFHLNYRAAQIQERVQVCVEHVHVMRRGVRGETAHWVVSPLWARVEDDGRGVLIASGGGVKRVAAFLSPGERASFARALESALWRAKRGG